MPIFGKGAFRGLLVAGVLCLADPGAAPAQVLTQNPSNRSTLTPSSAELTVLELGRSRGAYFTFNDPRFESTPWADVYICVPDCDSSEPGSGGSDPLGIGRWSVDTTCEPPIIVGKRTASSLASCSITVEFTPSRLGESRAELYVEPVNESPLRAPLRARAVEPTLRPASAELIAPAAGEPTSASFSLSVADPDFTPLAFVGICVPSCGEEESPQRNVLDAASGARWRIGDEDCSPRLFKAGARTLGDCTIAVEFSGPAGAESEAELVADVLGGPSRSASLRGRVREPRSTVSFLQSGYRVAEGARLTIPVERAGEEAALATALTLDVAVVGDGGAVEGEDYRLTGGTELSWAAGEGGTKDLVVLALTDTPADPEFFALVLDEESLLDESVDIGEIPRTTVSIVDVPPPAGELAFTRDEWLVDEDAGEVTLLVSRSGGSAGAVSVGYRLIDGTATAGVDHALESPTSGTLRWAAGDTGDKGIVVDVAYDADGEEGTESFDVVLFEPEGAELGERTGARVLIADVDPPLVRGVVGFVASEARVAEDAGVLELSLARSGGDDEALSVDVVSVDGTARAGEDYRAIRSTVTWPGGEDGTRSVSVPILFDRLDESDETFDLVLENPQPNVGVIGEPRRLSVTIGNVVRPEPGELRFTAATASVSENDGSVRIGIERVGGSDGRVGVAFATADLSATGGEDYEARGGTLIWADDEVGTKTITVPIATDLEREPDELFELRLTVPAAFADVSRLGSPATARVTIVDFVPPPVPGTLQWAAEAVAVDENAGSVELSVTRRDGRDGRVGVAFATADVSATGGEDYEARGGTLIWEDGEVGTKTITVPIIRDVLSEGDETFEARLTVPEALAELSEIGEIDTVRVTILDERRPGTLRLAVASASVAERDGSLSISVERVDGSDGAVFVDYETRGVTASPGEDFTAASGTLSWADGQSGPRQIDLAVARDGLIEETETFELRLANALDAEGAAVPLGNDVAVIAIEDATAPGRPSFDRERTGVEENDGEIRLTVLRLDGSDGELSVDVELVGVTAVAGQDFDAIPEPAMLTWANGVDGPREISIGIVDDAVSGEGNETFLVRLVDPRPNVPGETGGTEVQVTISEVDDPSAGDPDVRAEVVSGDGQSGLPGDVSEPLVIRALDGADGSPSPGREIAWSVVPDGAAELLDGGATVTDAQGLASNRVRVLARGFVRVVGTVRGAFEGDAAGTLRVDPPSLEVTGNQAVFTFRSGFFAAEGLRSNPAETGGALDVACEALRDIEEGEGTPDAAQRDLLDTCDELDERLGDGALAAALDRLTPEELFFIADSAIETADLQVTNVLARIDALRAARRRGLDVSGLDLTIEGQRIPGSVLQMAQEALFGGGGASADDPLDAPALGVFANGSVSFGEIDGGDRQRSADVRTAAVTVGADYRLGTKVVLGAGLGFSRNETEFGGGDDGTAEALHLSLFGTWYEADEGYADVVLDVGRNDYELVRAIGLPGLPEQRARGDTDATVLSLTVSAGRDFRAGGWDFGPYLRISLITADVSAYSESANEAVAGFGSVLDVRGHSVSSRRAAIGGQVSRAVSTRRAVWLPQLRFETEFESEADKDDLEAVFRHDPSATPFRLRGEERDTAYTNLGLGSSVVLAGGTSLYAFYETRLGHEQVTQSWLKAGLRLEF